MKNPNLSLIVSDLKALILMASTRKTKLFVYGFVFSFVACTTFLAFNSSSNAFSPWFNNLFSSSSSSLEPPIAPYRSQASGILAYFNPNSSSPADDRSGGANGSSKDAILGNGSVADGALRVNQTQAGVGSQQKGGNSVKNGTKSDSSSVSASGAKGSGVTEKKQGSNGAEIKKAPILDSKDRTVSAVSASEPKGSGVEEKKQGNNGAEIKKAPILDSKNQTVSTASASGAKGSEVTEKKQGNNGAEIKKAPILDSKNQTVSVVSASGAKGSGVEEKRQGNNGAEIKKAPILDSKNQTVSAVSASGAKGSGVTEKKSNGTSLAAANLTSSIGKENGSAASKAISSGNGKKREKWIEDMIGCDLFQGHWVKDESYPLYPEGSCPHIDEPFDCYLNGRPDRSYQKLRWQPDGCNIPR